MVRLCRPRDIFKIYRLQRSGVYLDLEQLLLYGYMPWYVALRTWLRNHAVTYLARLWGEEGVQWGMLQAIRRGERPEWDITFLAPRPGLVVDPTLSWRALLEYAIRQAVRRGIYRVYVAVSGESAFASFFQEMSFSLYRKETIYKLVSEVPGPGTVPRGVIRPYTVEDEWEFKRLWRRVTPRVVLAAEGVGLNNGLGLPFAWDARADQQVRVWDVAGELRGAVALRSGRKAYWMRVLVEREALEGLDGLLAAGLYLADKRAWRPVYCAVPDYMGGVGSVLLDHGFVPWGERVLLVRHLALPAPVEALAQQVVNTLLEMGGEPALSQCLNQNEVATYLDNTDLALTGGH